MGKKCDVRSLFARRVRALREEGGWTQEGFAAKVGLDRAYYGRVERGLANVTLETVQTIADGLGVEVRELFEFGG